MVQILLVEDDTRLNKVILEVLKQHGYQAQGYLLANEALTALDNQNFDLIISDIMMPEIDGFAFANMVRALDKQIPILFMSARDDSLSKEKGFRIGIDDYLVKPVNPEELIWRIEAILRRVNISSEKKIELGQFILDKKSMTALNDGEEIQLTNREFNLLFKLLSNPNQAFSRAQLMDEFWGFESDSTLRSVDVYITKLRDKLSQVEAFEIKTVYGVGYKAVAR
ncbi:response regulator transcription factor [Enterococcus sp. LJL120]